MITGITLENFKCFRRVEINPKRVTCFVGANGTGKSSVLQAFGLLKQSVEKASSVPNSGIYSLMTKALDVQGPLANLTSLEVLIPGIGRGDLMFSFHGVLCHWPSASPIFSYAATLTENGLVNAGIHNEKDLYHAVKSLKMVLAARGLVRPVYALGIEKVNDVSLQEGLSQQEEQTATNLAYSRPSVEQISPMLKRVTGTGLRADIVPPQSVEIKSLTATGGVNIVAEGFGFNALIQLLYQLATAERGATIMIEEPEIHLHPKAQAELAEVLAEVALDEDKQVIMTTHSEHITGRLLTLVAEGKLTPDDVAIYAFEKDEEGVCTAKNLGISDDGRIEGSIGDFFEVNLAEMNRMVKALSHRNDQAG